jgi:hypothetical protein
VTNLINCASDSVIRETFIFFSDTSKIVGPDTICESGLSQYKLSNNNIAELQYQWFIDNSLLSNDTNFFLQNPLIGIKNQYTSYRLKVHFTHRISGCKDSVSKTIVISPRPALRIDNTFDTSKQKCPFSFGGASFTTIQFTDSNQTNLTSSWKLNGYQYTANPVTVPLLKGINSIKGYFNT